MANKNKNPFKEKLYQLYVEKYGDLSKGVVNTAAGNLMTILPDCIEAGTAEKIKNVLKSLVELEKQIKNSLRNMENNLDLADFETVRARECYVLSKKLIALKMPPEQVSYIVYACLNGEPTEGLKAFPTTGTMGKPNPKKTDIVEDDFYFICTDSCGLREYGHPDGWRLEVDSLGRVVRVLYHDENSTFPDGHYFQEMTNHPFGNFNFGKAEKKGI